MSSDEDASSVRVAVRIRPLIGQERVNGEDECMHAVSGTQLQIGASKAFTFDYVFPQHSQQGDVYVETVAPLVENFFAGYNATVLAYGQTGSGKTFTMGSSCEGLVQEAS